MTDDQEMRSVALEQAVGLAIAEGAPLPDVMALAERFLVFLRGDPATEAPAPKGKHHRWSEAGMNAVRSLYPTERDMKKVCAIVREIERNPNLSRSRIIGVATRAGLHRPPSAYTEPCARAVAARRARVAP